MINTLTTVLSNGCFWIWRRI